MPNEADYTSTRTAGPEKFRLHLLTKCTMQRHHNSVQTVSIVPLEEAADAIILLEQVQGILRGIGLLADPNVDVDGLLTQDFLRSMGNAADGAARLAKMAQTILVEAKVTSEVAHG